MDNRQTQYKWEILDWSALKKDSKKWTLHESDWFDKKKIALITLKKKSKKDTTLQTAGGVKSTL